MAENNEHTMMQPNILVKEEPKDSTMESNCMGVVDCQTNRTGMNISGSSNSATLQHSIVHQMSHVINNPSAVSISDSNDMLATPESLPCGKEATNEEVATCAQDLRATPAGDVPSLSATDIDSSALDLSWLSCGDKPLNIADLSFEQFQLLYYQHLFRNMKELTPAKTKSKAEKRGVSESPAKTQNKAPVRSDTRSGEGSGGAVSVSQHTSVDNITSSSSHKADVSSQSGGTQVSKDSNCPKTSGGQVIASSSSLKSSRYGFTHKCSHCNEMFRSRLELTAHDKRAHPTEWDSDLQCEQCNKKFSSKYYLNQHELTHKGELPFSCDLCDKRFLCKGTLETHVILLHTDERPHKCDICGAAFKLKKILMRHISTHTKEAPYKCPNCDKCFSRRGSLNRHELIHTGEKPYKCELCQKCFTQKSTLTLHMMGHNNERPYQCTKCDKSFRKKSHLTRHDSVHTGKKRYYECKVCKKCFAEKYCLVEHEKTHEGEPNITSFYLAQRAKGEGDTVDYFKGKIERSEESKSGSNLNDDKEQGKTKQADDKQGQNNDVSSARCDEMDKGNFTKLKH